MDDKFVNLDLVGAAEEDKFRRKNQYKRIRSKAREQYLQSCGFGKPPLPQQGQGRVLH